MPVRGIRETVVAALHCGEALTAARSRCAPILLHVTAEKGPHDTDHIPGRAARVRSSHPHYR
jgi:hypothetical protein